MTALPTDPVPGRPPGVPHTGANRRPAAPRAVPPPFPFQERPGVRAPEEYDGLLARPGPCAVRLPGGAEALVVSRYAEVRAVLSDDRFSRARYPGRPMFARTPESLALATSDPPVHTRRRRAVLRAFTARRARQQAPWLRALAGELLDAMAAAPGPADLVEAFTVPFAFRAIARIIGIPPGDRDRLRPLVDRMMSTTAFAPREVAAAHEEAGRYFDDLVAARRAALDRGEPGSDLLTELLAAPEPERLTPREISVLGAGLLMAGYETTANQLAMCALMVFADPAWADELRAVPGAVAPAVEEMLRWSSLVATGGAPHVATEDVRLGGTLVRAGQVVVPLTDAANRDPAVFEAPGVFTPARSPNPHLAFGHGRHFCLGADLARTELRVGLTALLGLPGLTLAVPPEGLEWRRGMFIRGPRTVPVHVTPPPPGDGSRAAVADGDGSRAAAAEGSGFRAAVAEGDGCRAVAAERDGSRAVAAEGSVPRAVAPEGHTPRAASPGRTVLSRSVPGGVAR
ncbi:cytochrome P450 [Sphaerisporangium sp. B11E5]|uniref:cytochrome P450 n=1 Tax=Sphaerisporangium sp. B11E5 TaxID=3153563 RepID=UPI00325E97B8